jgi:hypothetical protein
MIRENKHEQSAENNENTASQQPVSQQRAEQPGESTPGNRYDLDQTEGRMNNGELGAGLKKED